MAKHKNRSKSKGEKIGKVNVFTAKRDMPDFCSVCFKDIERGQWFVKKKQNLIHYRCQKIRKAHESAPEAKSGVANVTEH